ncbi:MAG: T9SS type A sorting domain-containing protein, partial [Bacteroidetes bacterium]|nr:T9SS type A sorting domain-containing protein [Bacteroidota bacterium]
TYTATDASLFSSSKTQVWTPTNNPFIAIYNAECPVLPVTSLSTVIVRDKIIIPEGYNITIQGMKFEFKPRTYPPGAPIRSYGGRVLVQNSTGASKGGRLTLQTLGTVPTEFTKYSSCNGLWEGVEVWGNHTLVQGLFTSGKQGWMRMYSTAAAFTAISYAYIGAIAGRKDPFYNFIISTPSNGGGIIQSNPYSEFKNNAEGVFFMPYNIGNNQSRFIEAKFLTTANLNSPDGAVPTNMAFLNDIKGINFKKCTFDNDPLVYSPTSAGSSSTLIGIRGVNSQFGCTPDFLATSTGCTFKNLRYAVSANNGGSLKTVEITRCTFTNNYRGVYLNLVNYANINSNSFTVLPYTTSYSSLMAAYGVYMNFSKAFSIEDNSFTTINKNANCYGVILNQTNPTRVCGQTDILYRNRFNTIYIGAQTQGNNSEQYQGSAPGGGNACYPDPAFLSGFAPTPNNKGLVLKCNDFAQGTIGLFDANVANTQSGTLTFGNIAFIQGLCVPGDPKAPAGNKFSHSCSTAQSDYKVSATNPTGSNPTNFKYKHHVGLSPACYTPLPNGVNPLGCTAVYDANNCLPEYNKPKSVILFDVNTNDQNLDSANTIANNGDSNSLLTGIATNSPGQIKNDLLAQSPYLSDRVLIAAINAGLSPGVLKQILLANSPLSATVNTALLTISLPAGILNDITAAQTGTSALSDLYNYQSYMAGEKMNSINSLIRYHLNDTTITTGLDSVKQIFLTYDLPEAHCELAKCYLTKDEIANAIAEVDVCRGSGEYPAFCDYMDVFIALKSNNSEYKAIASDPILLNKLDLVSTDGNARESASAAELKLEFQNIKFEEWIEPNEFSENHRSMIVANEEQQSSVSVNHSLAVYPNPGNEEVTVLVNLTEDQSTATLFIYDITGRKIETFAINDDGALLIDTSNYVQGVYVCLLYVDSNLLDQVKLTIINK